MASNTKTVVILGCLFCLVLVSFTAVNFDAVMRNFMSLALQRERRTGNITYKAFGICLFILLAVSIIFGSIIIVVNTIELIIFFSQNLQSEAINKKSIIKVGEDEDEFIE